MKYLIRAVVVSVLVLPVFASAQTADIAAQAQALLAQIAALQAQLGVQSTQSTGASSGVCPSGRSIKPGSSGADVTALQQFLARDPSVYPEAMVTGYYGALTQAAVGRWQAKNGIVSSGTPATTGYGSVGPRTAAAIAAQCGGGSGSSSNDPVVGGFIKVSPLTGAAPLTVSVETTINTVKSCLSAVYTLNWGDGSQPLSIAIPANKCDILAQTYTHTYTGNGSYTITLSSGGHKTTSVVNVGDASQTVVDQSAGNYSTGGSASTGGTGSTQVASGEVAISMGPNSYSPGNVTVTSGTKITWTNTDATSHTVSADNGSYGSGTMAPGQTYSLTFTTKGEYTYYCAFHGAPGGVGMSGRITVQ